MYNETFFELIRFSLGIQDRMTGASAETDWAELYRLSRKHSILGVCFLGMQKIYNGPDDKCKAGISSQLYMRWMATAAMIQQKNDIVNAHSLELQGRISSDGLRNCILKGPGIASLYGEAASGLRQPGDIDIFVEGGREKVLSYLEGLGFDELKWDYVHAHPAFFKDTEVEVHYVVTYFHNLITNWRLQRFFKANSEELFLGKADLPKGRLTVPSDRLNLLYLTLHMYRHIFSEGLGLRQVMDYYFAILNLPFSAEDRAWLERCFARFNLSHFTSGLMWLLGRVFNLSPSHMLCMPDQHEGEFLLEEIMQSGNMGHMDTRYGSLAGNRLSRLKVYTGRSFHLLRHYPSEALATPFYYIWHFMWRRTRS